MNIGCMNLLDFPWTCKWFWPHTWVQSVLFNDDTNVSVCTAQHRSSIVCLQPVKWLWLTSSLCLGRMNEWMNSINSCKVARRLIEIQILVGRMLIMRFVLSCCYFATKMRTRLFIQSDNTRIAWTQLFKYDYKFVLFKLTHPKHFPFHYAIFNNSLHSVGMFCLGIQFFLHLLRTYFLVNIKDAFTPNTHGKKYRKVFQSDSGGTYSNKVDFHHTRVPVLTNRVRDSNSKLN